MPADLLCASEGCERRWVRTRDGRRYCFWHPDSEPVTAVELKEIEDKARRARPRKAAAAPAERPTYRAPGRVSPPVVDVPLPREDDDDLADLQTELDELEHTDPVVAAAAASYDAAVDRVLSAAAVDDRCETMDPDPEAARDREDVPRARPAGDGADPVEGPRTAQRPDPPARVEGSND